MFIYDYQFNLRQLCSIHFIDGTLMVRIKQVYTDKKSLLTG
jgi:hypothetical protein